VDKRNGEKVMNIKEFEVLKKKPYEISLVFELFEGSDFDKKAYKLIEKNDDLFAEAKMDNEVFRYNISSKMSLKKYLTLGMDRQTMLHIVHRFAEAEKFFTDNGLNKRYLMYDSDLILVDKESEEITFVTVPATDHGLMVKPLRAIIKEVAANAIYDDSENLDYVGRLINYANTHREVVPEDIEALLEEIRLEAEGTFRGVAGETGREESEREALEREALEREAADSRESESGELKNEAVYQENSEPAKKEAYEDEPDDLTRIYKADKSLAANFGAGAAVAAARASVLVAEPKEVKLPEDDIPELTNEPGEGVVVQPVVEEMPVREQAPVIPEIIIPEPEFNTGDQEDTHIKAEVTGLEKPEKLEKPENLEIEMPKTASVKKAGEDVQMPGKILVKKYPYLIRTKTQEIVTIDKDEFKIGKIPGMADFLLSDNPAVSRMHAIIHNIDGAYYVCDNYSTNATYLNGEKLEPGKNFLLLSGVKICFANDEFTYLCEK